MSSSIVNILNVRSLQRTLLLLLFIRDFPAADRGRELRLVEVRYTCTYRRASACKCTFFQRGSAACTGVRNQSRGRARAECIGHGGGNAVKAHTQTHQIDLELDWSCQSQLSDSGSEPQPRTTSKCLKWVVDIVIAWQQVCFESPIIITLQSYSQNFVEIKPVRMRAQRCDDVFETHSCAVNHGRSTR